MRDALAGYDYEHVFCDNASTDRTVEILREMASADPHIKVAVNSRNVGPMRNTVNGLKYLTGDLVVPFIPADLQDPPQVIPDLSRPWDPTSMSSTAFAATARSPRT